MGEWTPFQLGHDLLELAFAELGHPSRPTGPIKGAVANRRTKALARHLELL